MNRPFVPAALILAILAGCATRPLPDEVYRGYEGPDLPDASAVTFKWAHAFGACAEVVDDLLPDCSRYGSVKLAPGVHHFQLRRTFGVSVMVDPRMEATYSASFDVNLEAGHAYSFRSDRTYGRGYRVFFWVEDDDTGRVVWGSKKS